MHRSDDNWVLVASDIGRCLDSPIGKDCVRNFLTDLVKVL